MGRLTAKAVAVTSLAAMLFPLVVASGSPGPDAAARAAVWIASSQQSNGAFFKANATADGVADAVVAIVAGRGSRAAINRALPFIRAHGPAKASERAAYAGRIVMSLVAAGQNPRSFGGDDYVAKIKSFYDPVRGTYDTGSSQFSNSLALLGLLAAGETLPAEALRAIRLARCPDGGFSFDAACSKTRGSDVDTTSLVLCVFVAAGVPASDDVRADARAFLIASEKYEGGYSFFSGEKEPANANSTGLALAAIAALGEKPDAAPWRTPGGNPLEALLSLQLANGGFRYDATESEANSLATVQAVPGAAGRAFPVYPASHVLGIKKMGSGNTSPATATSTGQAPRVSPSTVAASSNLPASSPARSTTNRTVAAQVGKMPQPSRAAPISLAAVFLAIAGILFATRLGRRPV